MALALCFKSTMYFANRVWNVCEIILYSLHYFDFTGCYKEFDFPLLQFDCDNSLLSYSCVYLEYAPFIVIVNYNGLN